MLSRPSPLRLGVTARRFATEAHAARRLATEARSARRFATEAHATRRFATEARSTRLLDLHLLRGELLTEMRARPCTTGVNSLLCS